MYVKELDGAQLRYCLYVDDMLCTYPATHINPAGEAMHLETIKAMQEKYDLDDDGLVDCAAFIGMNFTWAPWVDGHRDQCAIDMPNKLNALLSAYDFQVARATYTPAVPNTLVRHDEPIPEGPEGDAERKRVEEFSPRSFNGLVLWIMRGYRPDIAYQVGALSRVAHCFNDKHIDAARHLLRYLSTTKDLQLVYRRDHGSTGRQPEVWVDADYAPDYGDWADNYRSTSAWLVLSNGSALNWSSRRQQRPRIRDWTHQSVGGNQSCIKQAANPCDREAQKHIDIRAHYLREQVHQNNATMDYVSTNEQIADALSKNLPKPAFEKLRHAMGLAFSTTPSHKKNSVT